MVSLFGCGLNQNIRPPRGSSVARNKRRLSNKVLSGVDVERKTDDDDCPSSWFDDTRWRVRIDGRCSAVPVWYLRRQSSMRLIKKVFTFRIWYWLIQRNRARYCCLQVLWLVESKSHRTIQFTWFSNGILVFGMKWLLQSLCSSKTTDEWQKLHRFSWISKLWINCYVTTRREKVEKWKKNQHSLILLFYYYQFRSIT